MRIKSTLFLVVQIFAVNLLSAQNLLNGPECVSFDSLNNRYLISNWTNGSIIAVDAEGNQSYFKQGLGHALGNCIAGNTIYVSIGTAVLGLNLNDPNDTVMYLPIPGTTQMDGMTLDDNNCLYVVASITARVYKINLLNGAYSIFVSSGISARPQDIIYDRNYNRLLVCSWYANSPIQAVNLSDSSVTTLVNTTVGNCDGLAFDNSGNYYFSSWTTNSIYKYDASFINPPELFSAGHNGPSNICFDKKNNLIAVPNFNSNSLSLVPIIQTSIKSRELFPARFTLYQNYPNPFNPVTTIKYELPFESRVNISVYNTLGQKVEGLVDENKSAGTHQIYWNAGTFSSGVYFLNFKAKPSSGNEYFSKNIKLVLAK